MAGVDISTVQRSSGTSPITMTQRYAHLSPEHKKAAIFTGVTTIFAILFIGLKSDSFFSRHRSSSVPLQTMKMARTFDVPRAPQEVIVRPDGEVAYVSCDASKQIAVLDLKNWRVEKLIDAGRELGQTRL